MNFIYLVSYRPLNTKKENFVEIFNEFTIMISAHITNIFLDVSIPQSAKDTMGWILMGFAALNIVVNLIIVVHGAVVYDIARPLIRRYELTKAQKWFN